VIPCQNQQLLKALLVFQSFSSLSLQRLSFPMFGFKPEDFVGSFERSPVVFVRETLSTAFQTCGDHPFLFERLHGLLLKAPQFPMLRLDLKGLSRSCQAS
jgi:hypothetical protein